MIMIAANTSAHLFYTHFRELSFVVTTLPLSLYFTLLFFFVFLEKGNEEENTKKGKAYTKFHYEPHEDYVLLCHFDNTH